MSNVRVEALRVVGQAMNNPGLPLGDSAVGALAMALGVAGKTQEEIWEEAIEADRPAPTLRLGDRIREFARPSENTDVKDSMEDPVIRQTVQEYESAVVYLGMDDAMSQLAEDVEKTIRDIYRDYKGTAGRAEARIDELQWRLADAYAVFTEGATRAEAYEQVESCWVPAFFSILEHALKGDPGCEEPEVFQRKREEALREHGPRLQWGDSVVSQHSEAPTWVAELAGRAAVVWVLQHGEKLSSEEIAGAIDKLEPAQIGEAIKVCVTAGIPGIVDVKETTDVG